MPQQSWFEKVAETIAGPEATPAERPVHAGQQLRGNQAMQDKLAAQQQASLGGRLGTVNNTVKMSEAVPNASRITSGAIALIKAGEKLKGDGDGTFWDDEELIQSGKNLIGLGAAMNKIGLGITNIAKKDVAVELDSADHYLKHATTMLNAAALIADLTDDSAAEAFLADPSDLDKAEAWGKDVAGTFKKVAPLLDAIPDGGLPGYIKTYWKGLMGAPSNYVDAFMVILRAHLGEIDKVAGSWERTKVVAPDNTSLWEGPLSGLYTKAAMASPSGLDGFMRSHRTVDGTDLWEAKGPLGKALLLRALYDEVGFGSEIDGGADKQPWIDLVADFIVV